MRAPDPPKPTIDDFVRSIVGSLKPWRPQLRQIKTGHLIKKTEAELRTQISDAVCERVNLLHATAPEHFTSEARRRTRDDARDLIKTVKRLENQIKRIRQGSPELRIRLGLAPVSSASSFDGVTTALVSLSHQPNLEADLAWLRATCAEAERGAADIKDQCKRLCVHTAWLLIARYSENEPTINRIGEVAALLHQAVTGLKPKKTDFRWLCQQMLRQLKSKNS
jgi:hypothetical protein